ncbi:MAG: PSD1 and planctomycete cytochrome C domain-containing protein [Aeoliella sp.]
MGLALLVAASIAVRLCAEPAIPEVAKSDRVSFNEHIRPIFATHCVACHGGVKQASGLSFIYRERALAEVDSGERVIVPGDVEASPLFDRITDSDPDYRMPPAEHGPPLEEREVALLKKWIEQGATWEEHWSFVAPQRYDAPQVNKPEWCRQPIDPFILSRLDAEVLPPSPEASRAEWLRRVTFDLIGLPPSEEELAEFQSDDQPGAFERVVDRLLASPHFGERWTAVWLDLARYSDTMGYEKDPHREMWPYRDWLIRALNADLPYDDFLIKQFAGDLLPNATLDDRVATGMHRNTQNNTEGGTDDEEFRVAAVLDRVSTTWQVAAGLTFGCAQCHSHPYDPIEHEEFYEFMAVFNSSRDCDLNAELLTFAVPHDRNHWPQAEELDRDISELRTKIHHLLQPLAVKKATWQYVEFDDVSSTGQTQLTTRTDPAEMAPEVLAGGTITARSTFTLSGPVPENTQRITALRIDVLPKDLESALETPEMGFALTRLYVSVELPGEDKPRDLHFVAAICDEPEPMFQPEASLNDNASGWSAYTRIDRPHWSVFVLAEPVDLPSGSRLKLVLKQGRVATGDIALVIDRGRYAVSSDTRWTELITNPEFKAKQELLAKTREARGAIPSTSMPAMAELPADQKRHSHIFERGNWLDKGAGVTPGVPALFPAMEGSSDVDRLAVARWFTSGEHPLTSRVMVNRAWEQLFGTGLVETAEDFGSSGLEPSHPELLDDLAVRFQTDMEWSFKALLREMVLSAAYRQTAQSNDALNERDPRNRLLARGPRLRLTAEMVRDQALVLSGRFAPKMFGKSVMPPQPEGVWRTVYSGAQWETAEGEDRYRRAIYTYWKRTSPYPSMMTFDAPTRDVCTVRRIATNTPLHALVTLNDPAYIECAQGIAERMVAEGGETPEERIAWAYKLAASSPGSPASISELTSLYTAALESYNAEDEKMKSLGATSEGYALTIVANAILNLDDVLTR